MSVAPFRLLQLFLIPTKLKGLAGDRLAFLRYLHLHELEGAARLGFRGTQKNNGKKAEKSPQLRKLG